VSHADSEPVLPLPPDRPHRLVYFGTPDAAVPPLRALLEAGFDVPLVVSRADRRRGRRAEPTPSPVKAAALAAGIPVSTDIADALEVGADCGVVVAFGRLIPTEVLARLPMLNVHFSLLPRWRGAAPVERAILAGDAETGVCLMALEPTLDTGPVYRTDVVAIGGEESADELRARLVELGSRQLVDALRSGLGTPAPQQGEAVHAAKITRDDLRLDWSRPAAELSRVVRVGGAWTSFRGALLKVHTADVAPGPAPGPPGTLDGVLVACEDAALRLETVQPEGRSRVDAAAWVNGARLEAGERLGG
jgi:methionyl-tRNA formyltransferase